VVNFVGELSCSVEYKKFSVWPKYCIDQTSIPRSDVYFLLIPKECNSETFPAKNHIEAEIKKLNFGPMLEADHVPPNSIHLPPSCVDYFLTF
jgi:hypothetical protein